jgi:hypothetical protein
MKKKRYIALIAVAGLVTALLIAAAGMKSAAKAGMVPSTTASAVAASTVITPVKPGPRGVHYTGLIQDLANPAWCLMSVHSPEANDPVILVQCTRENDAKHWIATMFRGIGQITMPIAPSGLSIGQSGKNNTARMVDPDRGGSNYILFYAPLRGNNRYAIRNLSYHSWYLSMPERLNNGGVYTVKWEPANTKGYTVGLRIGPWEEDEPTVVVKYNYHLTT